MDEAKHESSMNSDENFLGSQNPKQITVPNCFEPDNRVKSDNREVVDEIESHLIGELESIDLNDTSNDCLERNSPNMLDSRNTSMTDSANISMTDSPTSVHSQNQSGKKHK